MEGTVVTVGTFDGLHLGHQAILRRVRELARERNLQAVAYTFAFPPRHAAQESAGEKQTAPHLLLPQSAKRKLLIQYVDRVEQADFAVVRNLAPRQFVQQVLREQLAARAIVVGESFQFGRDREGNVPLLHQIGKEHGLAVEVVPAVVVDHTPVSSTRIRTLIETGRVQEAKLLLGRPPLLVGKIVTGDRLGRTLGYPTANLALDPDLLRPAKGIYIVRSFWKLKRSAGLLYNGVRPTLKSSTSRCEVFLFSAPEDELYGQAMEVHLLQKLRDDQAFSSLDALRRQLEHDVAQARSLLHSYEDKENLEPILA